MKKPVKLYLMLMTLLALLLAGCGAGQADSPAETPSPTPEVLPEVRINELMPSNKATIADGNDFPDWIELYNYGAADIPTPGFENSDEGYAAFQASRECSSPLVINEAMVYNEWYRSGDGGLYDWVELKNVSAQELRLSDYYLSDDGKERAMYLLPDETLTPGETYLVYCTGDASGSYAPFALNAQSDNLYLSSADGSLCDYTLLRGIKYGGSYGRMPGENGFFYFASARAASRRSRCPASSRACMTASRA